MSDRLTDIHADIRKVDSQNQLDAVLALPDHLRDALWRIESARLKEMDAPAGFVCGMGGSAIGGDLAAAALGDRLSKPLLTVRGYELPSWAFADSAVLCSSYSGNTEETLACYAAAEALGAQRLVATTGGKLADLARADQVPVVGLPAGLQPRAAVGYMFTVSAELAALTQAAPRINTEVDAAAAHLENRRDEIAARAAELAGELSGSTLVVHGSGLTAPVAYRWACQVNENAKVPAYSWDLPEANHNELVGWEGAKERGPFACVLLEDSDQHPRERRRMELTAELADPGAEKVVRLEAEGETTTARMLELVMLGDLISLHIAASRGVEPSSVAVIESLKAKLGD
jgi:glucose/mannose-6-phosphate isomerase